MLSRGGIKLQAVYLDILICVKKKMPQPSFRTHRQQSENAIFNFFQNVIRQKLTLTVAVVMALFAERCYGIALITAVLFTNTKQQ